MMAEQPVALAPITWPHDARGAEADYEGQGDPDAFMPLLSSRPPMRRPDSQWHHDLRASNTGWFAFRQEVVDHLRETGLLTPEREHAFGERVWSTLRRLYSKDAALAVELYAKARAGGLPINQEKERRTVRLLYDMLGFRTTEQLRLTVARSRSLAGRLVRSVHSPSRWVGGKWVIRG